MDNLARVQRGERRVVDPRGRGSGERIVKVQDAQFNLISDKPQIIFRCKCIPHIAWDIFILKSVYYLPGIQI